MFKENVYLLSSQLIRSWVLQTVMDRLIFSIVEIEGSGAHQLAYPNVYLVSKNLGC